MPRKLASSFAIAGILWVGGNVSVGDEDACFLAKGSGDVVTQDRTFWPPRAAPG
jgi:hypothetical protein